MEYGYLSDHPSGTVDQVYCHEPGERGFAVEYRRESVGVVKGLLILSGGGNLGWRASVALFGSDRDRPGWFTTLDVQHG